jgi:hypothetical protein
MLESPVLANGKKRFKLAHHPRTRETQKRTQTSSFGKNALYSTCLALKRVRSLIPKIVHFI